MYARPTRDIRSIDSSLQPAVSCGASLRHRARNIMSSLTIDAFNEDMDILLIHTVEQHPILYDLNHPKYSDSSMRERAWNKVAAEVKKPSKLCKSRWVNIRDALRRKVMHEKNRGGKGRRKYKYEDRMQFVKKHFKDAVYALRDSERSEEYKAEEVSSGVVVKEPVYSDAEYDEDVNGTFEFQSVQSARDSLSELTTCIQRCSSAPMNPVPEVAIDPFLASIGATLRQLTPYYLNQAKTKIFQVVQEFELAQIIEKDGRPSTSFARD